MVAPPTGGGAVSLLILHSSGGSARTSATVLAVGGEQSWVRVLCCGLALVCVFGRCCCGRGLRWLGDGVGRGGFRPGVVSCLATALTSGAEQGEAGEQCEQDQGGAPGKYQDACARRQHGSLPVVD